MSSEVEWERGGGVGLSRVSPRECEVGEGLWYRSGADRGREGESLWVGWAGVVGSGGVSTRGATEHGPCSEEFLKWNQALRGREFSDSRRGDGKLGGNVVDLATSTNL